MNALTRKRDNLIHTVAVKRRQHRRRSHIHTILQKITLEQLRNEIEQIHGRRRRKA
jgi:hypothetical protein